MTLWFGFLYAKMSPIMAAAGHIQNFCQGASVTDRYI
jgi:hypothetical protein